MRKCHCQASWVLPILVGIIAGIIACIFRFINIPFAIVALVVSIVFLILLLGIILSIIRNERIGCCVCRYVRCLLIGIFGTFIASLITLSVGLACKLIEIALSFLTVGFFFWMITALWLLIKCILNELFD